MLRNLTPISPWVLGFVRLVFIIACWAFVASFLVAGVIFGIDDLFYVVEEFGQNTLAPFLGVSPETGRAMLSAPLFFTLVAAAIILLVLIVMYSWGMRMPFEKDEDYVRRFERRREQGKYIDNDGEYNYSEAKKRLRTIEHRVE